MAYSVQPYEVFCVAPQNIKFNTPYCVATKLQIIQVSVANLCNR